MYIIALIGIGLFVNGFIVLTITAFKVNKQWGWAVMLIPFAQVFFPIYHWEKSKNSFSSFILGLSLWMGTAILFGEGALDEYWLASVDQVQSAEPRIDNRKSTDKSIEQRSKKFETALVLASKPNRTLKQKVFRPVPVNRLHRFTGEIIKITLRNNITRIGLLSTVKPDSIELVNYMNGGELSYHVPISRIISISVNIDS